MRAYSSDTDPISVIIAWGVTIALALLFVFCVPQKLVAKTTRVAVGIVVRSTFLASAWLAVCWLLNAPAWAPLAVIGIASVVAGAGAILMGSAEPISSPGQLLMTPLGVASLTLFVGADFVLGFPGFRELFALRKDGVKSLANDSMDPMQDYVGRTAIVVTPLKPAGQVTIGEQRFKAVSETGEYVDVGERVSISIVEHDIFQVSPANSEG
jgi:membrane-bound ClpP family serine protease